jgi:hypothetical protein
MKLTREDRNTRGKPVPGPLCPPQIPRGLTGDRTQSSVLGGWRITTLSYTKDNIVYDYFFAILYLCD